MMKQESPGFRSGLGKSIRGSLGLMALLSVSFVMSAQTVTLFGALSNFDVLNDTGQDAHGFEIEMQGVPSTSVPYTFNATRYGPSKTSPTPGGILIRWASPYDTAAQRFTISTVTPAVFLPTYGHSCVLTNIVGCDHYGVAVGYYGTPSPTSVKYSWLVADPNNPGQLMRFAGAQVQIPQPTVTIIPPAVVGNPPQVVFQIQVPPPPPPPIPKPVPQRGDAKWVKVYKSELPHEVVLEDLIADNPELPQDPAALETTWTLLQFNPNTNGNGGILRNQGGLGGGSRSVLRRYEFYKFTGAYDPIDHGAICADGVCNAPAPTEVGDFIGAQNAAANVGVPSVTVTVVGDGQVSSSNSVIRCPAACSMSVEAGTVVTLTAKNGRGIFSGWNGDCVGTSLTCTITVDAKSTTTATFLTPYKLNLRSTGLGTVTTDPSGTTFLSGTQVTMTATPAAGNSFVGWTDACAGTALTCTVTMTADTAVTANFSGVVAPPAPASYKLVVKLNGNGKVTTNPTGTTFSAGTAVTLTAAPAVGVPWIGWTGACLGTSLTCTVTMTADTTVTANFR